MTRTSLFAFWVGLLLLIILVGALAASQASVFDLNWWVMSGGGGPAASGSGKITVNSTIGQSVIGRSSTNSGTILNAGFWPGAAKREWKLLLPAVMS